ncbi:N-alpha-acetyltransferase 20 [Ditylenchus destructor]|uniref:N-alpha-acetyltransferase 20 n=1 Tax=Ditylenchus destructor TaxID=166010 RepID=A0AAD4R9D5_9BILA|nr:N-alpha-acetyltransferase 20 [Ditylenchus destructor]
MTTIRPFEPTDLFRFNNVNLDPLTETYGLTFYLQYLINWPEYFQVAEHPNGQIMGYIMLRSQSKRLSGVVFRLPSLQRDNVCPLSLKKRRTVFTIRRFPAPENGGDQNILIDMEGQKCRNMQMNYIFGI